MERRQLSRNDYFSVQKTMSANYIQYTSGLELVAGPHSPKNTIARQQINHGAIQGIPVHVRSSKPNLRLAIVSFIPKGKVAEMDIYHREHHIPLSSSLRINTLIIAANDLKQMGYQQVLTHVFIPGRRGDAGMDQPVKMKIDDWVAHLQNYESPNDFSKKLPL